MLRVTDHSALQDSFFYFLDNNTAKSGYSLNTIIQSLTPDINPNSGKPYLTDSLQRLWKEAAKAIGTDIELYQATRHSVASMAASSGVSIAIIKEVLGHADIWTTQKYSHVDVLSQSQVFAAQQSLKKNQKSKMV